MAQSSGTPFTNIPTRILHAWLRWSERYYEYFTLEKRITLFSYIAALCIGCIVFMWFSVPFSGRVDITMLLPLFFISVTVIFNADLLIVLLLVLYDTLISSIASSLLTVSAFNTLTIPFVVILVSTAYLLIRSLAFTSPNRILLTSPITKGLAIMLICTVGIGVAYHVKIGGQTAGAMAIMTAWLCYFITILGITSKGRYKAFLVSCVILSMFVAIVTIMQSYVGASEYLFFKLTSRDTRIEQLDGITRVIPQGYLLIYIMVHVCWQMFLTTDSFIKRWGWGLSLCLFITAMIVTMFRNMWAIGAVVMMIQYAIVTAPQRIRAIPYILALVIILGGTLSLAMSSTGSFNPIQSFHERIAEDNALNISDAKSSVGGRVVEIAKIKELWLESPLIGIGWGKGYESKGEWDPLFATYKITQSLYIHNTFWWVLGKSGILGLIGLLVFWVASLLRCWTIVKTNSDIHTKRVVTALGMAFASICISSMFHPYFTAGPDLILPIALLLGIVELQNLLTKDTHRATEQIS
ncbi:MAG: O-antigen ligase family protein [Armatimonadota bacterium]